MRNMQKLMHVVALLLGMTSLASADTVYRIDDTFKIVIYAAYGSDYTEKFLISHSQPAVIKMLPPHDRGTCGPHQPTDVTLLINDGSTQEFNNGKEAYAANAHATFTARDAAECTALATYIAKLTRASKTNSIEIVIKDDGSNFEVRSPSEKVLGDAAAKAQLLQKQ